MINALILQKTSITRNRQPTLLEGHSLIQFLQNTIGAIQSPESRTIVLAPLFKAEHKT